MKHTVIIKSALFIALALILGAIPFLGSSTTVDTAEANSAYTVDILVVDNFLPEDTTNVIGADGENCAVNTEGSGFVARGAGFVGRGAGFVGRGAGFVGRGAGFVGRGAGFVSRGAGFVSRGAEGPIGPDGYNERGIGFATRGSGFVSRGAGFVSRGAGFVSRGAGFATRDTQGNLEISAAHGRIVSWQLEELDYWYGDDVDINIVPVRVNDYQTDLIASQLSKAIDRSTADFIVANMSFAIIPCEMVDTFEEYLAQLADSDDYDQLLQLQAELEAMLATYDQAEMEQRMVEDDLNQMFAAQGDRVIAVASSGNYGVSFPFFPAGWDNIISVSGSASYFDFYENDVFEPDTTYPLLGYDFVDAGLSDRPISNYGEIMMPGQYMDIIGSSYAAPRLSYLIAYYLTQVGPDHCRNANGSFGLDYNQNLNLNFDDAAEAHCADMLNYVPEELPFDMDGDGLIAFTTYIEAEDFNTISAQGSWDVVEADFASGGAYVDTGWRSFGDMLELDFAGPFVEIEYIDGETLGLIRGEVDGRQRRTRLVAPWRDTEVKFMMINYLQDDAHTLEVYSIVGGIAVDGVYTTIMVTDPFAE